MIGGGIYNTTGFTGEGMLVAILDTGVDMGHEIFKTAPQEPLPDPGEAPVHAGDL